MSFLKGLGFRKMEQTNRVSTATGRYILQRLPAAFAAFRLQSQVIDMSGPKCR